MVPGVPMYYIKFQGYYSCNYANNATSMYSIYQGKGYYYTWYRTLDIIISHNVSIKNSEITL